MPGRNVSNRFLMVCSTADTGMQAAPRPITEALYYAHVRQLAPCPSPLEAQKCSHARGQARPAIFARQFKSFLPPCAFHDYYHDSYKQRYTYGVSGNRH